MPQACLHTNSLGEAFQLCNSTRLKKGEKYSFILVSRGEAVDQNQNKVAIKLK
jgi:hypothetical protein